MGYKECFEIMGKDRNSYSKTDLEATFMRMKEDHMMNGQLKPTYNVQIAVENYFIIHAYASNDRTDYNTLIPVLEKHKKAFGGILEEVTADSGYCSEKNLLYLKQNHISSYIKLQDHEKRKTRAYAEDIGKYYNMTFQVFEDEQYYICHDGRELHHIHTETREQDGYTQTFEVYGCESCSGCERNRTSDVATHTNGMFGTFVTDGTGGDFSIICNLTLGEGIGDVYEETNKLSLRGYASWSGDTITGTNRMDDIVFTSVSYRLVDEFSGENEPEEMPEETNNYAQQVLELVNVERAKEGLEPLTLDETLCAAADVRAQETTQEFSHTRLDGTDCFTILKEFDV